MNTYVQYDYDYNSLSSSYSETCFRQNTHFMFNNFLSENRVVFEKMWKHVVGSQ